MSSRPYDSALRRSLVLIADGVALLALAIFANGYVVQDVPWGSFADVTADVWGYITIWATSSDVGFLEAIAYCGALLVAVGPFLFAAELGAHRQVARLSPVRIRDISSPGNILNSARIPRIEMSWPFSKRFDWGSTPKLRERTLELNITLSELSRPRLSSRNESAEGPDSQSDMQGAAMTGGDADGPEPPSSGPSDQPAPKPVDVTFGTRPGAVTRLENTVLESGDPATDSEVPSNPEATFQNLRESADPAARSEINRFSIEGVDDSMTIEDLLDLKQSDPAESTTSKRAGGRPSTSPHEAAVTGVLYRMPERAYTALLQSDVLQISPPRPGFAHGEYETATEPERRNETDSELELAFGRRFPPSRLYLLAASISVALAIVSSVGVFPASLISQPALAAVIVAVFAVLGLLDYHTTHRLSTDDERVPDSSDSAAEVDGVSPADSGNDPSTSGGSSPQPDSVAFGTRPNIISPLEPDNTRQGQAGQAGTTPTPQDIELGTYPNVVSPLDPAYAGQESPDETTTPTPIDIEMGTRPDAVSPTDLTDAPAEFEANGATPSPRDIEIGACPDAVSPIDPSERDSGAGARGGTPSPADIDIGSRPDAVSHISSERTSETGRGIIGTLWHRLLH